MTFILDLDRWLLLLINGAHNFFLDNVMYYFSEKWLWIPLYLFFIYLSIRLYGKKGIWVIVIIAAATGLSDWVSVNLFKNTFMRLRPCHSPDLEGLLHLVRDKCGGEFGFYSSHASNHTVLAWLFGYFFRSRIGKTGIALLILWALVISYSRIYLGVHYPTDVLAGIGAGSLIALAAIYIARKSGITKPGGV
ncbi:MAG: phosphatase PAP2 family protein [Bacteroidales bacterium]